LSRLPCFTIQLFCGFAVGQPEQNFWWMADLMEHGTFNHPYTANSSRRFRSVRRESGLLENLGIMFVFHWLRIISLSHIDSRLSVAKDCQRTAHCARSESCSHLDAPFWSQTNSPHRERVFPLRGRRLLQAM